MIFSTESGKNFCISRTDKNKADALIADTDLLSSKSYSKGCCCVRVESAFDQLVSSLPWGVRLTTLLYLADTLESRVSLGLPSKAKTDSTEHEIHLRGIANAKYLRTLVSDKIVEMAEDAPPSRHVFDILMQTHRSSLSPDCVSLRLEQIVRHAPSVLNMGYKLKGLEEIIANQFDLDGEKAKSIVADAASQILETVKIVTPQTRAYYLGVVAGQVEGPLGDKARKEASIAYAGLSDKQRASVDFDLSRNVRRHVGLSTRNPSPARCDL